ncbi:IclR family transcriptional regulator [Nocardioides aquiterrae]|uniref:IclR family transcriptional regulator n=1 Tax=Nocardioides aquiterrae TaxID=203799 RepID=A0ABN1UNR2_9ACTN
MEALQDEGFVDRDRSNGRWHLGPELFLLGSSAATRYDLAEYARPHLCALAARTGESAFFSARRGDETVCLTREDGDFPIRSFVLYEGARFPLGVTSAGLAVLAHLPEREVGTYLERNDLTRTYGSSHGSEDLIARIAETRSNGYATNPGLVVAGSWGMAAAVFDNRHRPEWALTLTGVESRFTPDRRRELGSLLLRHAHSLSKELQSRYRW